MPREASVQERILKYIKAIPYCEVRKLHGNQYSVKGDPDLWGCIRGRMFVIEIKQPGEKPSELQMYRLEQWAKAGAVTGWADSVDRVREILGPLTKEEV